MGDINLDDISISPHFRVSDWKRAVEGDIIDWNLATEIFRDRLASRYLSPVQHIASDCEIGEFSGFAILAIDCLLIETLNQFYNGHDETKGEHRKAFWNFFKKSKHFKNSFSRKKAFTFYSHFRCGILHQAQIKKLSIVRIHRDVMIKPVNPRKIGEGMIVDREKFHGALEDEIKEYIEKLKSDSSEHDRIRENFITKMNYICNL